MKYLVALLAVFSLNALAITTSHTVDSGVTHSSYIGRTVGVENHFSKDYSVSEQGNMKSEKLDRVRGTKSTLTNFNGNSTKHYSGVYSEMNGADFSHKLSTTSYTGYAENYSADSFVKDGFERNTKMENGGKHVDHKSYEGSYVTHAFDRETTHGQSSTVETRWY